MVSRLKNSQLAQLVVTWSLLAGLGMLCLQQYEARASTSAEAPEHWPDDVRLSRRETSSTLLVFVHPHCPCSRATLGELERIVAGHDARISASVVFWHPSEMAIDWHRGSLWEYAQSIPGVRLIDDGGCVLTRQFGVVASGQTLLYDALGQLKFNGGITKARGHSGDNAGSDAVRSLAKSSSELPPRCCAVFGCPLSNPGVVTATQESRQ